MLLLHCLAKNTGGIDQDEKMSSNQNQILNEVLPPPQLDICVPDSYSATASDTGPPKPLPEKSEEKTVGN